MHSSPEASLGISVAVDSQIFQSDVYSASHPPASSPRPRKLSRWGERAVVVLIGIRLGIDGVNPIYYDTIKVSDFITFFTCLPTDAFPGIVHVPTIDRYRWWPPIVIILLRWLASGQPVLPGPPSFAHSNPIATTSQRHRTRARAWHTNKTNNAGAGFSITSRSS